MQNKFKVDTKAKLISYFNEHWYELNGKAYPSVTMILNSIAKGYGYDEWLKSVGHEANYIVREAQERGSKVHNAIESLILGNSLTAADDPQFESFTWAEWEMLNQWKVWYETLKVEPILIEQIVHSDELGVAGTVDIVCKINDKVYLLDWKTGGAYDSHHLQVAAYKYMAERMEELNGLKIDGCGIVYIGSTVRTFKDLNAPGIKVELVDFESSLNVYKNAVEVWKFKNPNAKPKNHIYPMELKIEGNVLKV